VADFTENYTELNTPRGEQGSTAEERMNAKTQARSYCVHGIHLQVCCSPAIAECLDDRFRFFPATQSCGANISIDFQPVNSAGEHAVERPQGASRPFYEMPKGEASYFQAIDEVYISFGDGLRALYAPRLHRVVVSAVECDPRNVFMASHLILTIILVEAFRRHGWYSLHAAGFSMNGKAILIPGTSGVGKSTLSVALLRAKFDYLTDDMVFLARNSEGVTVRGLAEDIDVSEQTIRFFPELHFLMQSPKTVGFTKRQLHLEEVYNAMPIPESRPTAIILPHISGKPESTIARIDGDEAFREIVPNVLLTQQSVCERHFSVLADLVKQARCYRLETGKDFDHLPILMQRILASDREPVCA
jgi:hypothetical protein